MKTSRFVILLPPSEGKADGGQPGTIWNPKKGAFGKDLGGFRLEIIEALAKSKGGSETLLGVKGEHLTRAQVANAHLANSPTLPAWQRYTGVVWENLDLDSIKAEKRKTLLEHIVIPSGLTGLSRADDLLPDYRLKMGARFAPFGTMSKWWRDDLTNSLKQFLQGRTAVDLLPQEHRGAIDWASLDSFVRVDLVLGKKGQVGGHNAKAAKGQLARHLLLTPDTKIESMVTSFVHNDYTAKVSHDI